MSHLRRRLRSLDSASRHSCSLALMLILSFDPQTICFLHLFEPSNKCTIHATLKCWWWRWWRRWRRLIWYCTSLSTDYERDDGEFWKSQSHKSSENDRLTMRLHCRLLERRCVAESKLLSGWRSVPALNIAASAVTSGGQNETNHWLIQELLDSEWQLGPKQQR